MANQTDSNVERKTPGAQGDEHTLPEVVVTATRLPPNQNSGVVERNPLHRFRSFTYNFTLAAIPPDDINKNEKIKEAVNKYAIIKSSGKKVNELQGTGNVEGFNAVGGSPGRFDMFLNNVEIDTLMSFNSVTNMALATKLSFEVYEPMSINGFMEALQVSAEASGNVSYLTTSYVLKTEFIGYPDSEQGPSTVIERLEEEGTRYFVIMITKVEAKMDENGTKYSVRAIARNEMGFSDQQGLKESIQMRGSNVIEICESLMNALTQAAVNAAESEHGNSQYADRYEVVFPTPNWSTGEFDFATPYSKFKEARITELSDDPSIFTYPPPGTVASAYTGPARNAGAGRGFVNPPTAQGFYDPNNTSVMFMKGAKVQDIIAAVIRDSEYSRKIVKNLEEVIDDQFVEYFHIAVEMETKDKWNPFTLSPSYIYRYIVYPYKMHFSRFPLFQKEMTTQEQNLLIDNYIRRKYEYLYTGKNVDVRTFNLTFNHLYFQAFPRSMNNANFGTVNVGAGSEEKSGKQLTEVPGSEENSSLPVPLSPRISDPRRASSVGPGGNASRPTNDTYDALVKNMHQAILDNLSMIKVDLEILGDPYFLCTGGIGNFRPTLVDSTITSNGEAPYQVHDVMVALEFRNPEDIDPNTGLVIFDKERVPFNGCYRVIKVTSKFQDGLFTQQLQLLRVPGQPVVASGRGKPGAPSENYSFLKDVPLPNVSIAG